MPPIHEARGLETSDILESERQHIEALEEKRDDAYEEKRRAEAENSQANEELKEAKERQEEHINAQKAGIVERRDLSDTDKAIAFFGIDLLGNNKLTNEEREQGFDRFERQFRAASEKLKEKDTPVLVIHKGFPATDYWKSDGVFELEFSWKDTGLNRWSVKLNIPENRTSISEERKTLKVLSEGRYRKQLSFGMNPSNFENILADANSEDKEEMLNEPLSVKPLLLIGNESIEAYLKRCSELDRSKLEEKELAQLFGSVIAAEKLGVELPEELREFKENRINWLTRVAINGFLHFAGKEHRRAHWSVPAEQQQRVFQDLSSVTGVSLEEYKQMALDADAESYQLDESAPQALRDVAKKHREKVELMAGRVFRVEEK